MSYYVITLITFLFPVGVLAIGALDIFANRNAGLSRTLFGIFLLALLSFFLFNLMTEVEMNSIQIMAFMMLLPISMLAAPILLMYQTSLMGRSKKLLGDGSIVLHAFSALLVTVVLISGMFVFSFDELNDILTSQKLESKEVYKIAARWILVGAHFMWYAQLIWYTRKIQMVYAKQRRKYGKYYAEYEERNEQLMLRQVVILMMVGVYDLMFWVVRVRNPILLIIANLVFGLLLAYLIISGKEQIDKKKYRMYKLSSHEDEVNEKREKDSIRKRPKKMD